MTITDTIWIKVISFELCSIIFFLTKSIGQFPRQRKRDLDQACRSLVFHHFLILKNLLTLEKDFCLQTSDQTYLIFVLGIDHVQYLRNCTIFKIHHLFMHTVYKYHRQVANCLSLISLLSVLVTSSCNLRDMEPFVLVFCR